MRTGRSSPDAFDNCTYHTRHKEWVVDSTQLSASDAYVALRWSLRDMLARTGVPTNPGWGDDEIIDALARQLRVSTKHSAAVQSVLRYGPGRLS